MLKNLINFYLENSTINSESFMTNLLFCKIYVTN